MSFVWKADKRLLTPEQAARVIHGVSLKRGLDEFATVIACMCVKQESDFWCPWNSNDPVSKNYKWDSQSNDGRSVAYFQQQNGEPGEVPVNPRNNWWGTMADRMDLAKSADNFLSRLTNDYHKAQGNPALASEFISNVQSPREDLRQAYAKWYDYAVNLVHSAIANPTDPVPQPPSGVIVPGRPDFNEINQIGWDSANPHGSPRSRPPINWFIHTQQGVGNAEQLAQFLRNSSGNGAVSYHYTIAEDPNDHGVTVCDVIDTDLYSWAVLDANVFSINACFAGSFVEFSRDEWLAKYRNAIRVAAYLAVEDCRKYSTLSSNVILPPYQAGAGISDHRYVTKCLGIGDHTDVGGPMTQPWLNFPWDIFVSDIHDFNGVPNDAPPVAVPPVTLPATDRELLETIAADAAEIRAQLGDGIAQDWGSKGMTLRDKVWDISKDVAPISDLVQGNKNG